MTERHPADPYTWRESVLSTRSLSYISTVDAFGTPSRTASLAQIHERSSEAIDDEVEAQLGTRRSQASRYFVPASVAHSLLFVLPQEIRDRVYSFCLASSPLPVIEWPGVSSSGGLNLAPQLLRTCKAIYNEAAPILYSGNAFSFGHPSDANIFVRAIASPVHSALISYVNLHMRAQDLRLWMPYLTSSSESRSLKHDFPSLKELIVRYRSTKWQHLHPIDANMRNWCEDKSLDEVIDGLRNTFYHRAAKEDTSQEIYNCYSDAEDHIMSSPKQSGQDCASRSSTPVIKVICMCRMSFHQFLALTADPQSMVPPPPPPPPPIFQNAVFIPQAIQQVIGITPDPALAEEGEEFRGFTVADLRGRAKRVLEIGAPNATPAYVARTVFADRRQILLALEVFAYEQTP